MPEPSNSPGSPAIRDSAAAAAQRLIRPLRTHLKRLLQELIRTNSASTLAGGDELPAQRILESFFREQGFQTVLYDIGFIAESGFPLVRKNASYRGRKNLSIRLGGTGRGKSLLLNGHIDTVPPGARHWSRSPWSGQLRQGRVYGLGSFDMKGGLVANAGVLCALRRARLRPGGDILFESVVDEEWGGSGGTIAARLRGGSADACVISEGTQLEIYRATRTGFVVDLVIDAGNSSNYFSKAEVACPAIHVGRLLCWIEDYAKTRKLLRPGPAYAGFADPVPVQILALESNCLDPHIPLSPSSSATIRVYLQFLPEEDVDALVLDLKRQLAVFCASDYFFSRYPVQWFPLIGRPVYGHELAGEDAWTRCLEQSASAVLKRPAVTTAAPYPCDAGVIQNEFKIPTLLFGPCGAGAHNPDEYVEFESVITTAETLLAAALEWTST